jgi:hydroxymethylpyrimidine/phosphomethylpyrimidine kinase
MMRRQVSLTIHGIQILGGSGLRDLGTIYATLGESGEVVLLAIFDGARTPNGIQAVTGLVPKLISSRLRALVDLKLATVDSDGYLLTKSGREMALIIAERRSLGESIRR